MIKKQWTSGNAVLLLEPHSICCQIPLAIFQDIVALEYNHTEINLHRIRNVRWFTEISRGCMKLVYRRETSKSNGSPVIQQLLSDCAYEIMLDDNVPVLTFNYRIHTKGEIGVKRSPLDPINSVPSKTSTVFYRTLCWYTVLVLLGTL